MKKNIQFYNTNQLGLAPILIIILLAIIAGSSMIVIKNISFNQPKLNSVVSQQSTSSAQVKTFPSPTITKKPSSTVSPKKNSPTPTSSSTTNTNSANNNSNNTSNNSNSISSGNPTSTPTPQSTTTSTPTPSLTPTPSAQTYSVHLTYPTGGETFKIGDKVHITWDATGTFNAFILQATDPNNIAQNIGSVNDSNARSLDWTADIGNSSLRQLKLQIIANKWPKYVGDDTIQKTDTGNYFTVSQ